MMCLSELPVVRPHLLSDRKRLMAIVTAVLPIGGWKRYVVVLP